MRGTNMKYASGSCVQDDVVSLAPLANQPPSRARCLRIGVCTVPVPRSLASIQTGPLTTNTNRRAHVHTWKNESTPLPFSPPALSPPLFPLSTSHRGIHSFSLPVLHWVIHVCALDYRVSLRHRCRVCANLAWLRRAQLFH